MPLHNLLGDFVGGFVEDSEKRRKENLQQQEQQDQLEQNALLSIMNSPDARPETKAAAMTGLLSKQPGKQSGFDKWFGKHQQHPVYGQVLSMLTGSQPGEGARPTEGSVRATTMPPGTYGGVGGSQNPGAMAQGSSALPGGTGIEPPGVNLPGRSPIAAENNASFGMPMPAARPAAAAGARPAGPPPSFYSPGERQGAVANASVRGGIDARVEALDAAHDAGKIGDQDYAEAYQEIVTGKGVATKKATPANHTPGTIVVTHPDGTTSSYVGNMAPDGRYYVNDAERGNIPLEELGLSGDIRFVKNGVVTPPKTTGNPSTGSKWIFTADSPTSANGTWQHIDAQGQAMGQPVKGTRTTPPPYPGGTFQTAAGQMGIVAGGNAVPVPGGAPPAVSQATNATQLRADAQRVDQQIKAILAGAPYFGVAPKEKQVQVQNEVAQRAGYQDYAALQQMVGQATQAVSGGVPPPVATSPGGGRGAGPAAGAGGGRGAAPPRNAPTPGKQPAAKGAAAGKTSGDPVADRVLQLLNSIP